MAAKRNLNDLPIHPSVDYSRVESKTIGGHTGPAARVTCPHCWQARWIAIRTLRQQVAKPNFTGSCKPCWTGLPKARTFRSRRNPDGRRTNKQGYVCLGKNAITDDDLPMFDSMRGKGGYVFEHRWVMAKHLGRALTSGECVDHSDGHHEKNEIGNLRLYVKGRQQPGSCPGHGTYYHEWQMAERTIRLLTEELHRVRGL